MADRSLAHDVNVIEHHDARHAWHLEDSLDFGWEQLRATGDDSYFRWMLDLIHREAEALRAAPLSGRVPLDSRPSRQ